MIGIPQNVFCARVLRILIVLGIFEMLRIFVSIWKEKERSPNLLNLQKEELFLSENNLGENNIFFKANLSETWKAILL